MIRKSVRFICGALVVLLLYGMMACGPSDAPDSGTQDLETGCETAAGETESSESATVENATDTEQSTSESITESGTTLPTQTTESETAAPTEPIGLIVTPSDAGYTYPDLQQDLAELANTYGDAFTYQSIGKSVDGREIYACVVGNPNAPGRILLSGGIHGKEYLSSLLVMTQVEYYLANREEGSYNGLSYAEMLDRYAFYVLPMINPDGVMLALCGIDSMQTSKARATVEKIYADNLRDGLTTAEDINVYLAHNWKANANGVDLNRNFALSNWSEVKTGILAPCFRNYKGPRAASEPETQAVSAYVESLGEIEGLLAFHTAGQVVYWDCGMGGGVRLETYDLAKAVCAHTGYKFIYEPHLDASLNDWITLEKDVPSVTIELANVIYPMPASELYEAWEQARELWAVAAQFFG